MKDFENIFIKSVYKNFGSKKVLTDFNLTLRKAEFVTFLGPSGCGKSTALNCIAGLIPLSSGEIYIDNECLDNAAKRVPAEKRGFGMVFQNYALFPHLNVYNNIAFGLQLQKLKKNAIQEKVTDILKLVHLEGYEEKFPSQMSGGEQQRVAIARCLVMQPRLLMLDEPLSNLDAKLRIDMRYEIKALHERLRTTSIYVTHDQQEALALSDRIVVMKKGFIQQIGTPTEIYSRPANLFVADFMGFKNIWPAKISNLKENGAEVEFTLDVNGIKLTAKDSFQEGEARKEGLVAAFKAEQEVLTAIRPDDFTLNTGTVNKIDINADLVEYLGQLSQIAARHKNGLRIDLRTDNRVKIGEQLALNIAPNKILLFPKEGDLS